MSKADVESIQDGRDSESTLQPPRCRTSVSYWQLLSPWGIVTDDILDAKYDGSGTADDPYLITFIGNDPGNPKTMPDWKKWTITAVVSWVAFIASLDSSSYAGTLNQVVEYFQISRELATVGLSLYVLGLGLGPFIWAPMSELYGRQPCFFVSSAGFALFNVGTTVSQNIQSLLILRFLSGVFASAPFTNATGSLADIFEPAQRGMALGFYLMTPFMGPLLGPAIGGFLGAAGGWRWVMGLSTILSGSSWIIGTLTIPETFGEVLLRRRARRMSTMTGKCYKSKLDVMNGEKPTKEVFRKAICRPWAILFFEPIVLLLSTWISVIYGTLYLLIAGFPIVFEEARGWSAGVSGLALLGIAVGTIISAAVNIPVSKRFAQKAKKGNSSPEMRLQPSMVGGIAIPIGLFWFAWTNAPSVPWPVSVVGSSFFGFGIVITWTSVNNYIVDAYKVYAASALAGQVVWRSLFGAAFPLFTTYMYHNLGLHWASSIPAFIALACAPLPFIFHHYGRQIRSQCRFARKADAVAGALKEKS